MLAVLLLGRDAAVLKVADVRCGLPVKAAEVPTEAFLGVVYGVRPNKFDALEAERLGTPL